MTKLSQIYAKIAKLRWDVWISALRLFLKVHLTTDLFIFLGVYLWRDRHAYQKPANVYWAFSACFLLKLVVKK